MSNGTEMRERVRLELGDTGDVTIWRDELLDALIREAVSWYSRMWPRQTTAYRDVTEGQQQFSVPPGAIGVSAVECPPGRVLPQEAGWTATGEGTGAVSAEFARQSWSEWGGVIFLGRTASGEEIGANKLVMRALVPWDRPDPDEDWNGPADAERLLVLWAAAEAWTWLEGQDQKMGRPARTNTATVYYIQELEREVAARRRAASSRIMSVVS